MEISNLSKKLIEELRKIYDNKDFVLGTMSIIQSEENRETLYYFIKKSQDLKDDLSQDDVLKLALILDNKNKNQ